ncbi:36600_t:CDS:2 [Gigaspora margarita]|uniref:36600_t:CDS:1 n=1 Tax=Gigaspora margarita TaxID=4874 RepID=A0ABN7WJ67_GIGMA|nr:36600_t:CDS:2 [Gigaspora margarita]
MKHKKTTRKYTKNACIECAKSKRKCESDSPQTCKRCKDKNLPCSLRKQEKRGPKSNQTTRKCDPKSNKATRKCDSETITFPLNDCILIQENDKNYVIVELINGENSEYDDLVIKKSKEAVHKFTPNIPTQHSIINSNNITSNIRTDCCPPTSYLSTNNEIPSTSAQIIPPNSIQRNDSYIQQPYDFQSPLHYYPPNNEISNTSAQTIPPNNMQRNDSYMQQPYDFQSPLHYYPPNFIPTNNDYSYLTNEGLVRTVESLEYADDENIP